MSKDFSVVISAPSGTGKSTLIKKLLSEDDRFEFSISTTSRSIRTGEQDGKEYHFVTKEEFIQSIENNEFLEWACVYGNYYGTYKKEIDRINRLGKIPLFDIDVQGARGVKDKLENAVYIFIIPPSLEILRKRLESRNTDTQKQIEIRLNKAREEIKEYTNYDYIVINDDLSQALDDFKCILNSVTLKTIMCDNEIEDIIK